MNDCKIISAAIENEVKEKLQAISKNEKRSLSKQAGILLALGLRVYQENKSIEAGNSQIDMSVIREAL